MLKAAERGSRPERIEQACEVLARNRSPTQTLLELMAVRRDEDSLSLQE
jgi:hypothetical protein